MDPRLQRRPLHRRVLSIVVGALGCAMAAVVGLVAYVGFALRPVEMDTGSWRDVDETVADWTRKIPHVGTPRHVARSSSLRGNVAKVDIEVASPQDVEGIVRALGASEAMSSACSSTQPRPDGELCALTSFASRVDGEPYSWHVTIAVLVAGPRFIVKVSAAQDYGR